MKKYIYALACIAIIGFVTHNATASDVAQTNPGDQVTVSASSITGAPDLTFNPSTNVVINGTTADTAFQITGYHDSADQKKNGQAYGMASDVNKLYWLDISTTAYSEPSGTNSGAFGSTWHEM